MLLGFADQGARGRALDDARRHFRRTTVNPAIAAASATEAVEGETYPCLWLSHGGLNVSGLRFDGVKVLQPQQPGGRRCLVPTVSADGETVLIAGVWFPASAYDFAPKTFQLVRIDGGWLEIGPDNWENWLDPQRDVRPMLRRSDRLVVPGHQVAH